MDTDVRMLWIVYFKYMIDRYEIIIIIIRVKIVKRYLNFLFAFYWLIKIIITIWSFVIYLLQLANVNSVSVYYSNMITVVQF